MVAEPVDLIFVVGASRSGTTLLAQVLGLHSKLHTLEETHFFGVETTLSTSERIPSRAEARRVLARLIARRASGPFSSRIGEEDHRQAEKILGNGTPDHAEIFSLFARFAAHEGGKEISVEQTPRNIFYAEKLLERYPRCRVVEIIRDPRAVLYSQRRRWRVRFSSPRATPFMQTLRVVANYHALTMALLWKKAATAGMKLQSHARFAAVRYEELVSEPEPVLRELCTKLGIDFEPPMLFAPYTTSSTRTARECAGSACGFYRSAVSEWEHNLPPGDRAICEMIAGDMATRRGYDISSPRLHPGHMVWHMLRYPLHMLGMMVLNPGRVLVQLRSVLQR